MTLKPPAERRLPQPQAVLDQVLADGNHPVRRTWLIPVAAAASVAVVAGGLFVASRGGAAELLPDQPPVASTSQTAVTSRTAVAPAEESISLTVGRLKASERAAAAAGCLRQVVPNGIVGDIAHPLRSRGSGKYPTRLTLTVTDARSGLIYGCVGRFIAGQPQFEAAVVGGDPAAAAAHKIRLNPPDRTHPAAPTEGMSQTGHVSLDAKPSFFAMYSWYRVDERVATMRQRILVNGKAGPWYVGDAVDGYVYLETWDKSTVFRKGDKVQVETQVRDKAGKLLDAPADQMGGGGLTPSPGTTRIDVGIVNPDPMAGLPNLARIDWHQRR
ncbi:hypothetical protein OG394_01855 [Kribbella sp. NBC_01245]|uniref:hypothetical protein n=1 Tax=Kribbella sp. NBC_01245 TaxID=2903578 RepID=UPI002E2D1C6F|nr:hypothetical protein [Kribbella sp. NBC_01245]